MDIKVSKYAGFCFGVKRAVDMVNELLDDTSNGRIFSLGDIIHNSHAMNALKSKGLTVISVLKIIVKRTVNIRFGAFIHNAVRQNLTNALY